MKKKSLFIFTIITAMAVIFAGCSTNVVDSSQGAFDKAPVFSKTTTSGEEFSLSKNIEEGKPTVVYFMASTCTKCAKNWEALNEVYPEYEDKVDFVAISVDPTDSDTVLKKLGTDKEFRFETVAGDAQLAAQYEVFKQTAKIAVDKEGNIVERHDGVYSTEEWRTLFESLA
jgi:cytochrome oxidase Cu insertion factor (SCO1/SenC/PrrC family)